MQKSENISTSSLFDYCEHCVLYLGTVGPSPRKESIIKYSSCTWFASGVKSLEPLWGCEKSLQKNPGWGAAVQRSKARLILMHIKN